MNTKINRQAAGIVCASPDDKAVNWDKSTIKKITKNIDSRKQDVECSRETENSSLIRFVMAWKAGFASFHAKRGHQTDRRNSLELKCDE
jgi:hypothetical protein